MNHRFLIPLVAAFSLLLPSCDRSSTDLAKKIAALEQKNLEAEIRQQELEHQLEDQKLAADRDAIERERMRRNFHGDSTSSMSNNFREVALQIRCLGRRERSTQSADDFSLHTGGLQNGRK